MFLEQDNKMLEMIVDEMVQVSIGINATVASAQLYNNTELLTSMSLCLCPRMLNWGRETSGDIWTELCPLFQAYFRSAIVYPKLS